MNLQCWIVLDIRYWIKLRHFTPRGNLWSVGCKFSTVANHRNIVRSPALMRELWLEMWHDIHPDKKSKFVTKGGVWSSLFSSINVWVCIDIVSIATKSKAWASEGWGLLLGLRESSMCMGWTLWIQVRIFKLYFAKYSLFVYLGHLSPVTTMQICIRGCSPGTELQIEEFYISHPVTLCVIFKVCF